MCRVARSPEGWREVEEGTNSGGLGVGRALRALQAAGRTSVHSGEVERHRELCAEMRCHPDSFSEDQSGC